VRLAGIILAAHFTSLAQTRSSQFSAMNLVVIFLVLTTISMCLAHGGFDSVGEKHECHMDQGAKDCVVDKYVGTQVIYEDERVRVWNFTLAPGDMTSMHRHDYDYHFVAVQPTQLQVWGEDGTVLFEFRAEGTLGFKVEGDYLIPATPDVRLPYTVPRTHAAKNIGPNAYHEILFETKTSCDAPAKSEEL